MISIIVAIDEKRGIGKDGEIPWHISEDFKRVKHLTMGHSIIMGRHTFESIGRVLPGRINIVISKTKSIADFNLSETRGLIVAPTLEEAIDRAKNEIGSGEMFIFGGGHIFKEAMEKDLVDRIYLTIIEGDYGADTFFPDYSQFGKIIFEEENESDGYKYKYLNLEKSYKYSTDII